MRLRLIPKMSALTIEYASILLGHKPCVLINREPKEYQHNRS